jgi:hypothetical protein
MKRLRENAFKGDMQKMEEFFRYYIIRSVIHEPLLWAKILIKELGIFYFPNTEIFGKKHYLSLHNLISFERISRFGLIMD